MQSFAVLGSHPDLSLAEIRAVTGLTPSATCYAIAIFDDGMEGHDALVDRLGGTQKLGIIIGTLPRLDHDELAGFLAADLLGNAPDGKMTFGVSVYGFGAAGALEPVKTLVDQVAISIKQRLKDAGRSARYVRAKELALGAPIILGNNLITKGAEYVLLLADGLVWVGKTLAVQPFDDWSQRDFGRPRRNAKQGMLPPKLARMMLNLAGNVAGKTVLDPFCGSGTVLMEAAMLKAGKLIGGDIADMAVTDTEANLAWLATRDIDVPEYELHVSPAALLATKLTEAAVDVLVTETYLGRPRRGEETAQDLSSTIDYLTNLYRESFGGLRRTLTKDAVLVIAAPVHEHEGRVYEIPVAEVLGGVGYVEDPITDQPLLYRHAGQLVGRRILRFRVKA